MLKFGGLQWICIANGSVTIHGVTVLLKQKIALVFRNSSYMGEKKAVKTFFCEIAPDKALSTLQCVGEEKSALRHLLHESSKLM